MVERFHLGGAKTGRGVRLGLRELPVLDVLAHTGLTRLTLLLAIRVDERVCQDPVEPSLEVGAFLELVEGGEGFDERLLDEILGVGGVARHAQRSRVELVEERKCGALEARASLLQRLLGHDAGLYRPVEQRPDCAHEGWNVPRALRIPHLGSTAWSLARTLRPW